MRRPLTASLLGISLVGSTLAVSVTTGFAASNKAQEQQVMSYSDLADIALGAQIVVDATIKSASKLSEKQSPGIPSGHGRMLVTAEVSRHVAGNTSVPATVAYLIDIPLDSRDRLPRLRGERVLLFLKSDPSRPGQFALSSKHSQLIWSETTDQTIRSILQDASKPESRIKVTGVSSAFNVPGSIPGESETQIFLTTIEKRPVSLSVLRRPGEQTQWSISLGEIVDESSTPAGRDTLLWYQLACFLPSRLPGTVLSQMDANRQTAVISDYSYVLNALGPCGRTLVK